MPGGGAPAWSPWASVKSALGFLKRPAVAMGDRDDGGDGGTDGGRAARPRPRARGASPPRGPGLPRPPALGAGLIGAADLPTGGEGGGRGGRRAAPRFHGPRSAAPRARPRADDPAVRPVAGAADVWGAGLAATAAAPRPPPSAAEAPPPRFALRPPPPAPARAGDAGASATPRGYPVDGAAHPDGSLAAYRAAVAVATAAPRPDVALLTALVGLDLGAGDDAAGDEARAGLAAHAARARAAAEAAHRRLLDVADRSMRVSARPGADLAAAHATASSLEAELAALVAAREAGAASARARRDAAGAALEAVARQGARDAGAAARRAGRAGAKAAKGAGSARERERVAAEKAATAARARAAPAADDDAILLLSSSDEDEAEDDAAAAVAAVSLDDGGAAASLRLAAPPDAISRLALEDRAAAAAALGPGPGSAVVAAHARAGIDLTRSLAACLTGLNWLNDEVINMYLALLQDRDVAWRRRLAAAEDGGDGDGDASLPPLPTPRPPRCHFLNTFFVAKLVPSPGEYDYGSVRRWTAPGRLKAAHGGKCAAAPPPPRCVLDCDAIIVPVHQSIHWTLAVVHPKAKTVDFWDSLGGAGGGVPAALARWACDEAKDKLGEDWSTDEWATIVRDAPRQGNSSDCGVFLVRFAECAARGADPAFSQPDMPFLRLQTAADLARGLVAAAGAGLVAGGKGKGKKKGK